MIKPRHQALAQQISNKLTIFDSNVRTLRGIQNLARMECLVAQFIDSIRRIEFVFHVKDAVHDLRRMEPYSGLFDPLKAAVLHNRRGNTDEAYWLVFLATHFGKHGIDGWRLAEDVYGKLNQGGRWDWTSTSTKLPEFHAWVAANEHILKGGDGVKRRFSNHRKYESLIANSSKGLPAVIESYVNWVKPPRSHVAMIHQIHKQVGQNPEEVFASLYKSMDAVVRFGRLGKFDFLTMLGKLGISPIVPNSAYLRDATGPRAGARLLFLGNDTESNKDRLLDERLHELNDHLNLGMQVLEDALCNWHKNPSKHVYFRG